MHKPNVPTTPLADVGLECVEPGFAACGLPMPDMNDDHHHDDHHDDHYGSHDYALPTTIAGKEDWFNRWQQYRTPKLHFKASKLPATYAICTFAANNTI